jgi:uncharacterized protein (DUF2267 family)
MIKRIFKWIRQIEDKHSRKKSDDRAINKAVLEVFSRRLAPPRFY